MGGAFPAGGWGWSWCDVEVPRRYVRSDSKRAQDCHVSVFHAPREIPVRLEDSSFTRSESWWGLAESVAGPVGEAVLCFGVVLCVKEFCVHVVG